MPKIKGPAVDESHEEKQVRAGVKPARAASSDRERKKAIKRIDLSASPAIPARERGAFGVRYTEPEIRPNFIPDPDEKEAA